MVPALAYTAAWMLMIAAMMLPTTLPILAVFRRVVTGNARAGRLYAVVVAGFLCAWFAFGIAAYALDWTLHAAARETTWFIANGWMVGAAVIGGAGLFQFSALKYRCLDKCRSPVAFTLGRWRGSRPRAEALALGLRHGLFCLGCCWSLMLLMFAVGIGSIGWMLMLAAVMAIEKNASWGRRVSAPVGVVLLVWAAVLVAAGTTGAV